MSVTPLASAWQLDDGAWVHLELPGVRFCAESDGWRLQVLPRLGRSAWSGVLAEQLHGQRFGSREQALAAACGALRRT